MNNVYDNGYKIIGNVYNVKEYICKYADNLEDVKDLIDDLEDLDAFDIVCVDYENGMGYTIEYWKESHKVV